ncbi:mitochondrial outer membrane translocase complex, subunit Tom20 domain-containing protein [Tricharina praecox]|uniref:mitochondrial outer membrane translocase complex, subunit Tom20 domain-containing protein n=1 Tax=Tricharina praecox TaxID=43433 RepID=UPI0022210E41|nr:mitochondrial outer membrane translocase complex, subunit Tom20 domain-containing protein [Tricharina praecox]KAI5853406.1 mitochondrial outer membrane translocase complex, subunit Tom20 domain-containing protein [Tricharina praecox]
MVETSKVVLYGVAAAFALTSDAAYFDYKRRNDVNFRKSLKREKRQHAKAQRAQQNAANESQREQLRLAVRQAQAEGFPTDVEEKEAYFMSEVAKGETLCAEGPDSAIEAALCFYRALKVYPQPQDLISIYDKTVPKHVLDLLAEMLAVDRSIITDVDGPLLDE